VTEPWWRSFFDETYADVGLAVNDPALLARVIDFLVNKLHAVPGDRVLDQCCGVGRLAVPLAERGVHVVGVDQIPGYVSRAAALASEQGVSAEFHCADAFGFVADPPCDAAFNWFTSFGYSEDDSLNIQMFKRAWESLKDGGRYAVDYLSMPWIFANFRARHYSEQGGTIVLQAPVPDFARGMIDSEWIFIHPDGRRTQRRISTKMYLPHEIVGLLHGSGFQAVELYGSIDGESFDRRSPRCIAVARK